MPQDFNFDEAMERVLHDAEFLKEMIKVFLREAVVIITAIEQSTSIGDLGSLQRSAHALKGCAANIGADVLLSLCAQIEEAIRMNDQNAMKQHSLALRPGLDAFKAESERVLPDN